MERAPHTPENSSETKESPKKKKFRELFRRFVPFGLESYTNFKEQSDEKEDSDEKKKSPEEQKLRKARRLFRKLFRREVQTEPVEVDREKTEKPLGLNPFSSLIEVEPAKPEEPTIETPDQSVKPTKQELVDGSPAASLNSPEETSEKVTEEVQPKEPGEQMGHIPLTGEAGEIPLTVKNISVPESADESGPTLAELKAFLPTPTAEKANKETIIERGSGGGAAALAYLAARRSAAHRTERSEEQMNKRMDKIEDQTKSTQTANTINQQRAEVRQQDLGQRVERVRTDMQPVVNRAAERHSAPSFDRVLRSEREETAQHTEKRVETAAERIEQKIVQRVDAKREAEKLVNTRYEQVKPEDLQQKVESLAEKNVALEGLLERRHEARDDNDQFTAKSSSGQGGVMSGQTPTPVQPMIDPDPGVVGPHSTEAQSSRYSTQRYRKAAVSGFVTALVVIAALIVMFFILR